MHAALRTASRAALAPARPPVSAAGAHPAARAALALGARGYASKGKRPKKASDVTAGPADAEASAADHSPFAALATPPPPPAQEADPASTLNKAPEDAATTPIAPVPQPQAAPQMLSLDVAPLEPGEGPSAGERTGARSSKDSLSSIERRQRRLLRYGMGVFALGIAGATVYMGREWDAEELAERKLTLETAPPTRYGRTAERFSSLFDFFSKPAWPELLPPPLPAPHQKPYTLLVALDDLIVSSAWDREHGWRTAKRPGTDYFLAYLSQFYEIVIFTTQPSYTADPIAQKLDPYGFFIAYKLYRESTRSGASGPVKDLSYLNRPLDKVILLDAHAEHAASHPENAVILPPWKGAPGDRGLVEMIPFLESIGIFAPADVRPVLQAYAGKDIPREYALKEAAEKRALVDEWRARGGGKGLSSGGFTFSSLFGGGEPKPAGPALPETYLERRRREAQANYLAEQKFLRENKDEWERLMKEENEQRMKEMGGTVFGMMAGFAGGAPPAKAADPAAAGAAGAAPAPAPVAKA